MMADVRVASLVAVIATTAVACGSKATSADDAVRRLERAIARHEVRGIPAYPRSTVSCRADPTTPTFRFGEKSVSVFQCRVERGRQLAYLTCQVEDEASRPTGCAIDGAPEGVRLFTTPELRAAPKVLVWKCEGVDSLGRDVGPAFVSLRDDPQYPAEQSVTWVTRAEAEALARARHATFSADC